MIEPEDINEEELTRALSYAGFILLAFELVKKLIVSPIRCFYSKTTFLEGVPFKSYEEDVLGRHKREFEACLLYLRDFMEALDSKDVLTIQALRKHRNDIAHRLPDLLGIDPRQHQALLERVDVALFKLSNHRTYMEIGANPTLQDMGIDWHTVYSAEYAIFREVLRKVRSLQIEIGRDA